MAERRPRSITGSAGSRIQVLLGSEGSDYLVLLDEDDGDREWQTPDWNQSSNSIPNDLLKQVNNCFAKGRYVTDVAFGPVGGWFITGKKRDGSGEHSWWGGTNAELNGDGRVRVAFGNDFSYVVLEGRNGWCGSWDVDDDLLGHIKLINKKNNEIECLRLFPNGGYFLSHSEATQWKMTGLHLGKELKNGGSDPVLDVSVDGDGDWIVIRPNRFVASVGVSNALCSKLAEFYRMHQYRQKQRSQKIKAFDARIQREKEEREAIERAAKEEEARRLEVEQLAKNQEEETKKRRAEIDRMTDIRRKRLRIGDRVTAIGFSHEPGDAMIQSVGRDGTLVLEERATRSHNGSAFTVRDPRTLSVFEETEEDSEAILLLCSAKDKYEAAVSVFHCICHAGVCKCTKIISADLFLPSEAGQPIKIKYDDGKTYDMMSNQLLQEVTSEPLFSVRPILEHRGEVEKFDEYKCAEKIDMRRLELILADLRTDRDRRDAMIDRLERMEAKGLSKQYLLCLKQMQRCKVLEAVAKAIYNSLKDLVRDKSGCVVHEVEYEHRDPSCRGRLFAIGQQVKVILNDKYPRTATLQGMHSDLRALLVGEFAHDIDCENSEVRLVCSLSTQLDLNELIPILFDYRDNRKEWLDRIARLHAVSESEAKRLPNIILSGGRYETWLRNMGMQPPVSSKSRLGQQIKDFVFKLYSQIHSFRDQLLHLPRFKWTSIDREKLRKEGISDRAIDSKIMPRIVQCCENEVLGIMHRDFFDQGWLVRAKVFDGLVVESCRGSPSSMGVAMKLAEAACHARGWDIRLSEKPLYGKQDEHMQTVVEARKALDKARKAYR